MNRETHSAVDHPDALYGLEYYGIPGSSSDCKNAVMRLLQGGELIVSARIISARHEHCLILTNDIGDQIAIKSGFASGYGGEGPTAFSLVLELLRAHGASIDECKVEPELIERLDRSALTNGDVEYLNQTRPIRPNRWSSYILSHHDEGSHDGTLWSEFRPVIPYGVVDARIIDLALTFWDDPDSKLMRGYRRLEDTLRERTGFGEHNTKLFSRVFSGNSPALTWEVKDESEKTGRANLFASIYMAYRNPRAHQENPRGELLAEFLLLNHLFRLEKEAVKFEPKSQQ